MLTGVILAGGENSRMGGKNKALLPFFNEKLIERQIREMKRICNEIIVVTNDPKSFLPVLKDTVRIITDFIPGKGPMSGLHAALSLSKYDELWIVGCDMPYISAKAAELLYHYKQVVECDVVVPLVSGKLHPLHAIYTKRSVKAVTRQMESGNYDLNDLIDTMHHVIVDEHEFTAEQIDLKFVLSMNTTEQYHDLLHKKV